MPGLNPGHRGEGKRADATDGQTEQLLPFCIELRVHPHILTVVSRVERASHPAAGCTDMAFKGQGQGASERSALGRDQRRMK